MEFWEHYRREFPVTRQWIYMNHAAVSPLPRRAAQAMRGSIEDVSLHGVVHHRRWTEACEALRSSAARLIGSSAEEIAIVKNTSEGLAIVANGIDWRPGDVVVGVEGEFPANYYPWCNLQKRGVKLRWVQQRRGAVLLEDLDQACSGARLLAISFVQYLSGFRADLEAIGEICARRECLFVVDAIQGLGAFPVDVRRTRIHALCAGGHKWLLGPEGCGILYVNSEAIPQIEPVEFGWTNVAHWQDYESRDATLRAGAARYECGSLNTAGCYGLLAALDLLLEIGVERIGGRVAALAQKIAHGLSGAGYEILGRFEPASLSGIVSFKRPGADAARLTQQLAAKRIIVAPRSGWVRASPHFYISDEEAEELVETLKSL
jgi:selenocysteine lyase/cysteine desulfurase